MNTLSEEQENRLAALGDFHFKADSMIRDCDCGYRHTGEFETCAQKLESFLANELAREREEIMKRLHVPIVQEFITGTLAWYEELFKDTQESYCPVCGITPKKLKELAQALSLISKVAENNQQE